MIAVLCVMIVRRYTNSAVTRLGLQIGLWNVKGTVACSDGLNGKQNLDTDCRSITSHIALMITPVELSISYSKMKN